MAKSFILALLPCWLIAGASDPGWAQPFFSPSRVSSVLWMPETSSEILLAQSTPVEETESGGAEPRSAGFESDFAKGQYEFGITLGYGSNFNLPPVDAVSDERTRLRFAYVFPNFKYNLTGLMGKSVFRGALYWVIELGAVFTLEDPERNNVVVEKAPTYQIGMVPFQMEYKFLNPGRNWAPFVFGGVGVSWGDWFKETREIATAFEFILQAGAGIEYFFDNGTALNFNYRLWHLSNSNIKSPNIGINAHVFSLGFRF